MNRFAGKVALVTRAAPASERRPHPLPLALSHGPIGDVLADDGELADGIAEHFGERQSADVPLSSHAGRIGTLHHELVDQVAILPVRRAVAARTASRRSPMYWASGARRCRHARPLMMRTARRVLRAAALALDSQTLGNPE